MVFSHVHLCGCLCHYSLVVSDDSRCTGGDQNASQHASDFDNKVISITQGIMAIYWYKLIMGIPVDPWGHHCVTSVGDPNKMALGPQMMRINNSKNWGNWGGGELILGFALWDKQFAFRHWQSSSP